MPATNPQTKLRPALGMLLAGVLLSLAGFGLTRAWEKNRATDEFKWRVARHMVSVWSVLDQNEEMVVQVRNLFLVAKTLNVTNLNAVMLDLRTRFSGVRTWEYAEMVLAGDRSDFEARARAKGSPDFAIREALPDGSLTLAPPREFYLPVMLSDPTNAARLGVDLSVNPNIQPRVLEARDSGKNQLIIPAPGHVLVMSPIPKTFDGASTPGAPSPALRGFLSCLFDAKESMDDAFRGPSADLELMIHDVTPGETSEIIYRKTVDPVATPPTPEDFQRGGFSSTEGMNVLNRHWNFMFRPTQGWLKAHAPVACHAVLAGGLLFSFLLAGYVRSLCLQRARIDHEVLERTTELSLVNQRLAREVERRNHAEAVLLQAQRISGFGSWEMVMETGEVRWSDQTYRIYGQDPAKFQPTLENIFALIHPEDVAMVQSTCAQAIEQRQQFHLEYRIIRPDGPARLIEAHGEPIGAPGGSRTTFIGTVLDITEAREARRYHQEIEAQLRQALKLEAVGTLAGGIAHDFNNILGAIIGNADLLRLENPPESRATEYAGQILQASHRARELVAQILTFSRPHDQKREAVPLQALVTETVGLLRPTLPAGVSIRTKLAPEPLHVLGDPSQIHQVLMNLCANAAQAMDGAGGVLELTEENLIASQPLRVLHGFLPPGPYVALTVQDNGPGIAPQHLERIFDPFFTTKPIGQGTGLGLAVVHGIMKSHGGGIAVASVLGSGATFRLFFPRIDPPTKAPPPPPVPVSTQGTGSILFIDDEPALTALSRRTLSDAGYEVAVFNDPLKALSAFVKTPLQFDAVVTDLSMPHLSGTDFLQRLRETGSRIPVLLTSGNTGNMMAEEAKARGFSNLLLKPYNAQALCEAVSGMLATPAGPSRFEGSNEIIAV